jgi:hypothetical protein
MCSMNDKETWCALTIEMRHERALNTPELIKIKVSPIFCFLRFFDLTQGAFTFLNRMRQFIAAFIKISPALTVSQ